MKKNKVLSNSIWSITQQFISLLVSFVMGIFIIRYLGTEKSGIINVLNSVVVIIASISWLGLDSIIVNELVKNESSEETIIWTTMFTKIIVTFLTLFIFVLLSLVFNVYDSSRIFVVILLGVGVVFQSYETLIFWFQKHLLVKCVSICSIFSMLISLLYQIYLLIQKKDFVWFSSVTAVHNIVLFFLLLCVFLSFTKTGPSFKLKTLFDMLKISYHYIISALAITLYMQIDKVMIGEMLSDSDAGVYSAAVNVAIVWQFVPLAIINSFRPIILHYKVKNHSLYMDSLKLLNVIITSVSFLFCIFIYLISEFAVVFLYGVDFSGAVYPLRITLWATMISMLGVVRGIWLVAEDYNKYDKFFTIIAAIVNVVLNYILIKKYNIVGAAWATVISYFLEVFMFNCFFKDTKGYLKIYLSSFLHPDRLINTYKTIISDK